MTAKGTERITLHVDTQTSCFTPMRNKKTESKGHSLGAEDTGRKGNDLEEVDV